jgi:hypothetical protein
MRRVRPRLTYANVTATLALFVALGGTGYAAGELAHNSVGNQQLKRNAVTGAKIRDGTLTGADIRDQSLTAADIAQATLTAASAHIYKTAAGTAPAGSAANSATATCDSGQQVVGGGVMLDTPKIGLVNDSFPDANNTAWTARVGNASNGSSAQSLNFTVYAICAPSG